jgi:hypothetical protein
MSKPTIANPCPHTAELSGFIAGEAASVVELLSELIGAGSIDANTLAGARLLVARMGALADTLAVAHGGQPWSGDFDGWMLQSTAVLAAFKALRPLRATEGTRA